jgi:hypothetical protein
MAIVVCFALAAFDRLSVLWLLLGVLFLWEIVELVGRRKTTETIPYSAIQEVRRIGAKGVLLRVRGDESFKLRFRGKKKFQIEALVGTLEARMGS